MLRKCKQPVFQRIIDRLKINHKTKCWEWTGCLNVGGYGQVRINYKTQQVHRIVYKYFYGSIPENKPLVLHRCDNPKCCNPIHLYAGTDQDNMDDRVQRNPDSWPRGEKSGQSKLTEKNVLEIKNSQDSRTILAKRFNVSKMTIKYIKNRRTWKHI